MGNLIIQIASLGAGREGERGKSIFNINAHIYKGFNKWIKFICTRTDDWHGGSSVYGGKRQIYSYGLCCVFSLLLYAGESQASELS